MYIVICACVPLYFPYLIVSVRALWYFSWIVYFWCVVGLDGARNCKYGRTATCQQCLSIVSDGSAGCGKKVCNYIQDSVCGCVAPKEERRLRYDDTMIISDSKISAGGWKILVCFWRVLVSLVV